MPTNDMLNMRLDRMNKLINTNFDKCSKVDNCTDDRREFLILIDKNNKDDEER